jgi:hypothetical protein
LQDFLPSSRKNIERNGKFMFGGMVVFNYDFIPWKITFKINFKLLKSILTNLGPQGHQKGQKNHYATL